MAATPTVVVIGSSGNVGKATVKALANTGVRVIAGVRNPDAAAAGNAPLVAAGATLVKADMSEPATLVPAIPAGSHVLIITPGHEDRARLATNAVEAAKAAGAAFVGVVSVLSVPASGIFAEQFRPIENAVAASGIPFTIYRLPMFLDNVFGQPLRHAGNIFQATQPDAPYSTISVSDIGEALALGAAFPARFANRTLNIAGSITTGAGVAEAFSAALGKKIDYVQVDDEGTLTSLTGNGVPKWQANGIVELLQLIRAGDKTAAVPEGDNHTVELLGRAPTSVAAFARAVRFAFLDEAGQAAAAAAEPATVVLGASGSVGAATVKALRARGARVIAGVRNPDPADAKNAPLVAAGAELVRADMGQPDTLAAAIPKGSRVLVVTPGTENKAELAANAVAAAAAAEAALIGVISVPSVASRGVFASQFREVENAVVRAGRPFAIFRVPFFVNNILMQPIKTASSIFEPAAPELRYTTIAVSDIGEAVANGLLDTTGRFRNRTLTVAGTVTSGAENAAAISRVAGKQVNYVQIPPEAFVQTLEGYHLPAWQVRGSAELYTLRAEHDKTQLVPAGDNDTRALLGREPQTVEQFAQGFRAAFV